MFAFHPDVLRVMFEYQPPNDDTAPRYATIGKAHAAFAVAITEVFADLDAMTAPAGDDYTALHARVSLAAHTYAACINETCPGGHPLHATVRSAVESVTLARMWANRAIRSPAGPARGRLISLARTEAEKAALLTNSVIALHAPVSVAYNAAHEASLAAV